MKPKGLAAGVLLAALLALALARAGSRRPQPRPPRPPPPARGPAVEPLPPASAPAAPRALLERAATLARVLILEGTRSPELRASADYVTNLPVGYFQLLVRAFPEEAFEVFSTAYLSDPEREIVAYWALGELARLRHGPTFQIFNARLENRDPVQARRAIKALAHYDVPQLADRFLALLPGVPDDADEADLVRTVLVKAAAHPTADPRALDAALDRYGRLEAEHEFPGWYDTPEAGRRAAVLRASDPAAALAETVRLTTGFDHDDLERTAWAADLAVRRGWGSVAPALRDRVARQIEHLRSEERLPELDVLERHRKGEYDISSTHSFRPQDVPTIAHLRQAIHLLGGELSEDERRWLDGLRMLRTPREYLVEAGLLSN